MSSQPATCGTVPGIFRSNNHLLQALTDEDAETLWPHLQSIEIVSDTILIEAGAPVTHLYLQAGIISYSRGHIDIDDPQSLEATSCQCYRVVKKSARSVVEGLRCVAARSRPIIFCVTPSRAQIPHA
jgi:hypothetical protein